MRSKQGRFNGVPSFAMNGLPWQATGCALRAPLLPPPRPFAELVPGDNVTRGAQPTQGVA